MNLQNVFFRYDREGLTEKDVLTRAGFYNITSAKELIGKPFYLRISADWSGREEVVKIVVEEAVRITEAHFGPRAGLWVEVDKPTISGLPVRGLQYVVYHVHGVGDNADAEGWYIGLGNDPKGEFLKLEKCIRLKVD